MPATVSYFLHRHLREKAHVEKMNTFLDKETSFQVQQETVENYNGVVTVATQGARGCLRVTKRTEKKGITTTVTAAQSLAKVHAKMCMVKFNCYMFLFVFIDFVCLF